MKPTLEANAPQLAQKNINLKILRVLPLYKPPLTLQEVFSRRLFETYSIIGQQEAHFEKSEYLIQSLMSNFFA